MKLDEFFRCVGGGYGEAKARFQNDERIVRFLNMFPGDDSMQNLTNAMNTGDTTYGVSRGAHAQGRGAEPWPRLARPRQLSDDGSAARGQDSMSESVQPLYVAVQKEHTAVCSALEQLEK